MSAYPAGFVNRKRRAAGEFSSSTPARYGRQAVRAFPAVLSADIGPPDEIAPVLPHV